MARRSSKGRKPRGRTRGKTCVKVQDCGLAVARAAFGRARDCASKRAAAEGFRMAAAKVFRFKPKAEKAALFRESLRKVAAAERACGNAEAAQIARDRERLVQQQMDGVRYRRR